MHCNLCISDNWCTGVKGFVSERDVIQLCPTREGELNKLCINNHYLFRFGCTCF